MVGHPFLERRRIGNMISSTMTGWWFGTFIFPYYMGMSSSQLTFICFRRVETTNQMKCWRVPTYSVKNIQSGIIKHGNREIPNFNCRQVIDDFPIQASIYRAGHVDPSGSHPVCEAEVPHLQSVGANLCTKPSAVWTGRIKVAASHRMATIRCILIPGMEVNI